MLSDPVPHRSGPSLIHQFNTAFDVSSFSICTRIIILPSGKVTLSTPGRKGKVKTQILTDHHNSHEAEAKAHHLRGARKCSWGTCVPGTVQTSV